MILIASGVKIILNPKFFDTKYGMFHDYTSIKWPLGGFLLFTGILIFAFAFVKKLKNNPDIANTLMCKTCAKPFYKKDVPNLICPVCHDSLEELEGFYERHPELKK